MANQSNKKKPGIVEEAKQKRILQKKTGRIRKRNA